MTQSPLLPQGHYRQVGVVLKAKPSGEKGKTLFLLLREIGPAWVSAPGAVGGRSRLSGATEPLVWGYFNLYRSPRKIFVKDVEIQEDFWSLRQDREKLLMALRLCGHVVRFALPWHPQDDLIPLLFWSLKALEAGTAPEAVEFRFLFRWTASLGTSPRIDQCGICGNPLSRGFLGSEGIECDACSVSQPLSGGFPLEEMELNRLKKAVMLSGKEFRAETFGGTENHLFSRASALFLRLLESSV